ncbi:MAG: class I SAM-dependent methyltransferase [Pseudomonadota bacterium]|nr:class I SAM-dependent methyltransferase [Pseudomonadota bacterium]
MAHTPSRDERANIPAPTHEARAHSALVVAHIERMIAASGGWISFADYMGAALYAPGLGYYVAGARKFGSCGDFVTAPELSALFGQALAAQIAELISELPNSAVIELGPGTGRLAADLLSALRERAVVPERYCLLEVSPDLRARQREQLQRHVPELLPRVEWIDVLPQRWRGALVANEMLDAIAPHLIARRGGAWYERGVELGAGGNLRFGDRALSKGALRDAAMMCFPDEGDYLSEINPAAQALVRSLALRCDAGALLLLDYGFPASEYYHPQRTGGTLVAHYRHRVVDDPFFLPGLADLTAHVDFSAIARAGVAGGMAIAGYATQARFLVNCGILDALARRGDPRSVAYIREAAAVQKLLSPAEMGEFFKVLAMSKGVDIDLIGFRDGDQSHRL